MDNLKQIILLLFVAIQFTIPTSAQTHKDTLKLNSPIQKVYKFNDNLFWGMTFGGSYSMSEYVRKEPFFKMLGPNVDIEFGKHLNKRWAARLMVGYHGQQSSYPQEMIDYFPSASSYHFSTISGYGDIMFCLDRLFTRYNPQERHQFWAFGGVGGMLCFGYSKKISDWNEFYSIDTSTKIYPVWRVGLEWHYKVSNSTSLVLRGLYATTNSAYDGKELDNGSARHFAEVSIGFNVHLGNRYGQRCFENCGHNANRYFNVMNSRLAEMHYKANKKKAKQLSKQYRRKVEPEVDLCEQDTILLFPVDYFYLTDMQKSKLRKMATYLAAHPDERAHIDIYPDAGSVGSMEMEFRVTNRAERVREFLTNELKLSKERFNISTHANEQSPYKRQHIFCLGGIIRYEKIPYRSF